MRKLLLVCLASCLVAVSASAMTAQKRALIQELLRVSGAADVTLHYIDEVFSEQYGKPKGAATTEWMHQRIANDADFARLVETTQSDFYDRYFTDTQLQDLISFYKSDAGRRLVEMQSQISSEARQKVAGALMQQMQEAEAVSKQKRTMADMRTLAIAIEARATDTNQYPKAGSIDDIAKLIEPTYIKTTPRTDRWSNLFRYFGSPDGTHYRIVSGGPDGKVDAASMQLGKLPAESSDDLIFEDGVFRRPQSPK